MHGPGRGAGQGGGRTELPLGWGEVLLGELEWAEGPSSLLGEFQWAEGPSSHLM